MKAALVAPATRGAILADRAEILAGSVGVYPPLGLMFLAAAIRRRTRHEVRIFDGEALQLDPEPLAREIIDWAPDYLGITTLTFTLHNVYRIARLVKASLPGVHIGLGGPHTHIYPHETMLQPFIDSVITGEGELALPSLLDAIEAGDEQALPSIPGLWFRRGNELIQSAPPELIRDLDSLPFPDRFGPGAGPERYGSILSSGGKFTTMITSRGCPYQCLYCLRPHLGKKFRARSPENVMAEIEHCVRKGISEIHFFDDTFTVRRERILEICRLIQARGLKPSWRARARADTVDLELLQAMARAGCTTLSFGIESGDEKVLAQLRKGINIDQARAAIRACKQAGIEALADFMLGAPGEGIEEMKKTLALARSLDPDWAQFTITTPYPATDLYSLGFEKGLYKDDYWKQWAENPDPEFHTPVWEENFTEEQLVHHLKKAYRGFYWRPKYIFKRLLKLRSPRQLVKMARAALRLLVPRRKV